MRFRVRNSGPIALFARAGSFFLLFRNVYAASGSAIQTTQAPTATSALFATPPASLNVPADFTAGFLFSTDFLKEFFSGFGPSQTSVEPQPKITDPVVSSKRQTYSNCISNSTFRVILYFLSI